MATTPRRSMRTTQKKRRTRTRTKGGLHRRSSALLGKTNNPHRLPMDCCPCVFKFFGLKDMYVNKLVSQVGHSGMYEDDILGIFRLGYPEYHFWMINASPASLDILLADVPPGHFVFAVIGRGNNTYHCIAIGRNNIPLTQAIIVYDVQVEIAMNAHEYMKKENVVSLFIVNSGHKITGDSLKITE